MPGIKIFPLPSTNSLKRAHKSIIASCTEPPKRPECKSLVEDSTSIKK